MKKTKSADFSLVVHPDDIPALTARLLAIGAPVMPLPSGHYQIGDTMLYVDSRLAPGIVAKVALNREVLEFDVADHITERRWVQQMIDSEQDTIRRSVAEMVRRLASDSTSKGEQ